MSKFDTLYKQILGEQEAKFKTHEKISEEEFDKLKEENPDVEVAKYQAGNEPYFMVERNSKTGKIERLVHYFKPIF